MYRAIFSTLIIAILLPIPAYAQYDTEEVQGPWHGGAGNYVYPVVCTQCSVWQDFRNFGWNQLSTAGGFARTPNAPGTTTAFRIFTDTSNDKHPTLVEVTLEIVDIVSMGTVVGHEPASPKKFIVETTMDNGDKPESVLYSPNAGPFRVPYAQSGNNNGDDADESASNGGSGSGGGSTGGGGDSPSGGGSAGGGGAGVGSGGGFGGGGGGGFGGGNGNFCGPGTDYDCVRL